MIVGHEGLKKWGSIDGCFNISCRRIDLFQYIKMQSGLVASRQTGTCKQPPRAVYMIPFCQDATRRKTIWMYWNKSMRRLAQVNELAVFLC